LLSTNIQTLIKDAQQIMKSHNTSSLIGESMSRAQSVRPMSRGEGSSVVVLAGGRGRRLGAFKPFTTINGVSLVEMVIMKLRQIVPEVLVVTDKVDELRRVVCKYGVKVVEDEIKGIGPIAGVYTGLRHMTGHRAFICGSDMIFINPRVVEFLLKQNGDVVVPIYRGYPEPLHAVYSRSILPIIGELIKEGMYKVSEILKFVKVNYVHEDQIRRYDPCLLTFFNINTREDLEEAEKILNRIDKASRNPLSDVSMLYHLLSKGKGLMAKNVKDTR